MTGPLLALLLAGIGLALAAWVGRQERTAWQPWMLGGITGIAGVGALNLAGGAERGLISVIGALLMYGAAVAAVAIMAGKARK